VDKGQNNEVVLPSLATTRVYQEGPVFKFGEREDKSKRKIDRKNEGMKFQSNRKILRTIRHSKKKVDDQSTKPIRKPKTANF
jgi:hypothetical protein